MKSFSGLHRAIMYLTSSIINKSNCVNQWSSAYNKDYVKKQLIRKEKNEQTVSVPVLAMAWLLQRNKATNLQKTRTRLPGFNPKEKRAADEVGCSSNKTSAVNLVTSFVSQTQFLWKGGKQKFQYRKSNLNWKEMTIPNLIRYFTGWYIQGGIVGNKWIQSKDKLSKLL